MILRAVDRAGAHGRGCQVTASRRSGSTGELGEPGRGTGQDGGTGDGRGGGPGSGEPNGPGEETGRPGSDLLAALLDGMDAALCALDAEGTVTHWNREAERILGWSAEEAVGRRGFSGWAVREADAAQVADRLLAAMDAPGRQVHEFALLTKDGGRVLVRTQSAAVRGADGSPAGVYCAFSEVHAQIDLERSLALSEALFEDASWGVVLVDADLRPAVVNTHAARAFGSGRSALLGRPLGELLAQGAEELESALTHVLAAGAPPAPAEMWLTLRTAEGERRRCWRNGFLRLSSPLAEEPVPLGVGWLFQDVTESRRTEQESARLRFRGRQLHRAALAAAECEDPGEAAVTQLDFALAGFADHALLDAAFDGEPARLVRFASAPAGGHVPGALSGQARIPVGYEEDHPALLCVQRAGSVRADAGGSGLGSGSGSGENGEAAGPVDPEAARRWAARRQWPEDAVHALCVVLRSRARTLGAVTFLRGGHRPAFTREDAQYAESVAARLAAALDLAGVGGAD
ncbi:PAS domain-containing protein [Streptomyces sp. LD120]|uniref:PAS domain-containing protein n=1 Tax=Streptomyces physcomitrii TaxID=2724184 RepID=A0ABX1H4K0_9ACTN|nr:PAS domain-containing protein [Streptomyces physcomitrii]NKI43280.1 PAS domain-containing protein [Streptomyces physcomitrii]